MSGIHTQASRWDGSSLPSGFREAPRTTGFRGLGFRDNGTQRDIGIIYPNHKGSYYYRNHTLYHIYFGPFGEKKMESILLWGYIGALWCYIREQGIEITAGFEDQG